MKPRRLSAPRASSSMLAVRNCRTFLVLTSHFSITTLVRRGVGVGVLGLAVLSKPPVDAQTPIRYRFTFPEPQHHWMQVEASFEGLADGPFELRMSVSSPGRYSAHDFAKNVYDVQVLGAGGRELPLTRPDPHAWVVEDHGGSVTARYKVFGDQLDGTYLAIDATHAHVNMPAAIMWGRGLDDRPAALTFEPPAGVNWRAFTQLLPGASAYEFAAPNLQYLMDSPVELGPGSLHQFSVDAGTFRVALHHDGSGADADGFVADVARIVREQLDLFGELPAFEPGHYTFLADFLPYADGDAMEHRNSTVLTSPSTIASGRLLLLGGVAHEMFHAWNVERIRPRSLEPFAFDRVNMSGELWLAEGFTEYFGALTLSRAGLADLRWTAGSIGGFVTAVVPNAALRVRSAEEMSRMATFTDRGQPADRTNWSQTVISYYDFGAAIALALDLTLRDRSDGRVTLDDYMRAMWTAHGRPGGRRPGYVDRPYTAADAEARLAEVSGDAAFARGFFARFVQGREVADYEELLGRAGLVLRRARPGRASLGDVRFDDGGGGARVASPPPLDSPAYAAGLDVGDEIRELAGDQVRSFGDLAGILARRRPRDVAGIVFVDRSGTVKRAQTTLAEDQALEVVPVELAGGELTAAQRAFRERWLN
jgi:predicted metalloprotease with PDZ domain